jgi:hypothetical protein
MPTNFWQCGECGKSYDTQTQAVLCEKACRLTEMVRLQRENRMLTAENARLKHRNGELVNNWEQLAEAVYDAKGELSTSQYDDAGHDAYMHVMEMIERMKG